jgi:hypothetical protein
LGDAQTEHSGIETVLNDDDLAKEGIVDVIEIILFGVDLLATTRTRTNGTD